MIRIAVDVHILLGNDEPAPQVIPNSTTVTRPTLSRAHMLGQTNLAVAIELKLNIVHRKTSNKNTTDSPRTLDYLDINAFEHNFTKRQSFD